MDHKALTSGGLIMTGTTPFNCHHCGQNGLQPMQGRSSPRQDAFFNGASNLTFGVVGSAGAIIAAPETGGSSALALSFTAPEIGIGMGQIIDTLGNKGFDSNSPLQQSSSLPGLVMYSTKNKYADYGDALGQFIPGMISGGNIIGGVSGIGETLNTARHGKVGLTIFNGLSVADAWLDTTGLWDSTTSGQNNPATGGNSTTGGGKIGTDQKQDKSVRPDRMTDAQFNRLDSYVRSLLNN